jgi:hypothetical protein
VGRGGEEGGSHGAAGGLACCVGGFMKRSRAVSGCRRWAAARGFGGGGVKSEGRVEVGEAGGCPPGFACAVLCWLPKG